MGVPTSLKTAAVGAGGERVYGWRGGCAGARCYGGSGMHGVLFLLALAPLAAGRMLQDMIDIGQDTSIAILPGCFQDERSQPVRQLPLRMCW